MEKSTLQNSSDPFTIKMMFSLLPMNFTGDGKLMLFSEYGPPGSRVGCKVPLQFFTLTITFLLLFAAMLIVLLLSNEGLNAQALIQIMKVISMAGEKEIDLTSVIGAYEVIK